MTQLIVKGGFRERANRSRKYQQSENKRTTLENNTYQPQKTTDQSSVSNLDHDVISETHKTTP